MDIDTSNLSNLKTDDRIADILKKLKEAETKANNKFGDNTQPKAKSINDSMDDAEETDNEFSNTGTVDVVAELSNMPTLPWFTSDDKDNELMHYIKFDNNWNLVHESIPINKSVSDIATLKLKKDYVCDIDFYKSKHYVLCVKSVESSFDSSRVYSNESNNYSIEVEDTQFIDDNVTNEALVNDNPSLEKVVSEDVISALTKDIKYSHYVVLTDMGIADFVISNDENYVYPYSEPNLSKWFEDVSNYNKLENTNYISYESDKLTNSAANIPDHKYDIITMHSPGVITLDSTDDIPSVLKISLKDEFKFLPLNRVLGCLKYYASHTTKNINDFRIFINKYFDVIK